MLYIRLWGWSKEMGNIAYYYTSLNTLFEIVDKKSLLLTDLTGMNDPEEGSYTPEDFIKDLKECKSPDENTKAFVELVLSEVELNKKKYNELCNLSNATPFAMCFSRLEDSLLHWERYGDSNKGVCISFNLDKLIELQNPVFHEFLIKEILYTDKKRAMEAGKGLVDFYNIEYEQINEDQKKDYNKIISDTCLSVLAAQYSTMLYFIKKSYWVEEQEIRLFYDENSWEEKLKLMGKIETDTGISVKSKAEQSYRALGLEETEYHAFSSIRACKRLNITKVFSSELIPEIKLGSFCRQNTVVLERFLKFDGLSNTKISTSKIKIR